MAKDTPDDVAAINKSIRAFLRRPHTNHQPIGRAYGIYVFFDYDEEPIYVGQTKEGLSLRIGRHLTNQRTDAVAMNVLDPFEVAYIEVWPLWFGKPGNNTEKVRLQSLLNMAEYTVFQRVLKASKLGAILNEKDIAPTEAIDLPTSYKQRIIPDHIFQLRRHPDIRIARRANTIARLAQVISERDVSAGLRRTLLTQARRLAALASERFAAFQDQVPIAEPGEETGEASAS